MREISQLAYENAIKSFNLALVPTNPIEVSDAVIKMAMSDALRVGYIFDPKAYSHELVEFITNKQFNPNSTFYKTWEEVTSKSRFELAMDQVFHYFTTYGGLAPKDSIGYVPNDNPVVVDITSYKIICAGTLMQIAEKCLELVYTGIALSSETLEMCRCFVKSAFEEESNFNVRVDDIKNSEFRVWFSSTLGVVPTNPIEMLRILIYKATNSALLIKSPEAIEAIKRSDVSLGKFSDQDCKKLSSIFYRFKPLFLAFKNTSEGNAYIINKIRRLAIKNHRPIKIGVFESLKDPKWTLNDIITAAGKENVFKIIRGMGMLRSVIDNNSHEEYTMTYIIRNKKSFTRGFSGGEPLNDHLKEDYNSKYEALKQELYRRLRTKYLSDGEKYALLSDKFNLTCPVSEKQFIGNIPYGTSYNMKANNYFGVYWRGDWGTDDFDLSFSTFNGQRLGWNSDFMSKDNDLIFSGDMTRANPEASEMFYCAKTAPEGILHLSRFCGIQGSKAKIYFGCDDLKGKIKRNYMVDSNTVEFTVDIISDKRECNVGAIIGGVMYIMEIQGTNRRVAGIKKSDMAMMEGIKRKLLTYIDFKSVLEEVGIKVVYSIEDAPDAKCDFDFSTVDKDSLIKFFSDTTDIED